MVRPFPSHFVLYFPSGLRPFFGTPCSLNERDNIAKQPCRDNKITTVVGCLDDFIALVKFYRFDPNAAASYGNVEKEEVYFAYNMLKKQKRKVSEADLPEAPLPNPGAPCCRPIG